MSRLSCDRTVGSYAKLQGFSNDLQPPRRVRLPRLPQGTQIPVKAVRKTYLRVMLQGGEPFDFAPALIFLVDDPNWEDVLIGKDSLSKYDLLPEQQIERQKADEESHRSQINERINENENSMKQGCDDEGMRVMI